MKIALILTIPVLILSSCNNGAEIEKSRTEAMNDLRGYVDSVETQVVATADVDWDRLDERYNRLEDKADKEFENAPDETRNELDRVEEKYDNLKENYETQRKEFNRMA